MPACETVVNLVHENSDEDVTAALAIVRGYRTCEFTTVSRDGMPQTWPVSALLLNDARILVSTSIGFPQKAFNIRRNPKVSHQTAKWLNRFPEAVVTAMSPDVDTLQRRARLSR